MPKKQREKKTVPFEPEILNEPTETDNEIEEENDEDIETTLASWEFPEHEKMERGKWWYLIFIVIALGCLVYSYFSQNPMFALIIVLFIIIYIVIERREPALIRATLTIDGLWLNNKFLDYKNFANFYIIYYPPRIKNIYLQPRNSFKSIVTLSLTNEDPVALREILLQFLPEDLTKENMPATDSLARLLKL
jgi:hypothetical protein